MTFRNALLEHESICMGVNGDYKFETILEWEDFYKKDFEEYSKAIQSGILSNREYFLDKVIEECSEVIKEAMKAKLFGWDHNFRGETNGAAFKRELDDLQGTLRVLSEVIPDPELRDLTMDTDTLDYRRDRLLAYSLYSESVVSQL